jgi:hypothetical protein
MLPTVARELRGGPTPNGGAYSVLIWLESLEEFVECERPAAKAGEILEYARDGSILFSTLFHLEDENADGTDA